MSEFSNSVSVKPGYFDHFCGMTDVSVIFPLFETIFLQRLMLVAQYDDLGPHL